jgi:hypothetical protein
MNVGGSRPQSGSAIAGSGDDNDRALSPTERIVAAGLMLVGLIMSGVLRVYDAGTWPVAVSLTALNILFSISLFWIGLVSRKAFPGRRMAGAVWAALPWNSLLLSQIAYIGFFFIPLEIIASAVILRRRAGVAQTWVSLLLAATVRVASLTLVYFARPALGSMFPWR